MKKERVLAALLSGLMLLSAGQLLSLDISQPVMAEEAQTEQQTEAETEKKAEPASGVRPDYRALDYVDISDESYKGKVRN